MRLIVILLVVGMHLSAFAVAQKVTLNHKNAELATVLKEIKKQTGYNFLYDADAINKASKITLNAQDVNIKEVLDHCFKNLSLQYVIQGKNIIISRRTNKNFTESEIMEVQQRTIQGTVRNEKGAPLVGVSILVKGTTTGTSTDRQGFYTITLPKENSVLIFSSMGYATQEANVLDRTELSVMLKEQSSDLEEVVIVGYGTQKKSSVTGALSVLNMRDKENQPHTNVSQALHGVSGLWVNQAGGKPGQDVGSIKVRGIGTLNNSNPLVLVDGIEYNMNDVNPEFIESVTVLKDASAAIYGSRAANGVILITTKQGVRGRRKINYSYSHGFQKATALPDVEWDAIKYMELKNTALRNEGKTAVDYSDELIEAYRQGMDYDPLAYPSVNWFDEVLTTGILQQHNLSFSGGSDAITYNLAAGYSNHDGILIAANNAKRYSINMNITANISDKFKIGGNFIGNYRRYTEPAQGADATDYYFNRLMRALPIYGTYLPDGRYANLAVTTPSRSGAENLIQYLKEGTDIHTPQRLLAKVFAEYQLPFHINYNFNIALDKLDGYSHKFEPILVAYNPQTWTPGYAQANASAESYNENLIHPTIYHSLDWEQLIGDKHNLSVMLGQSYERYNRRTITARTEGYFDNTLEDLNAGSLNPKVSGGSSEDILASYFGRLGYDYQEKYLLEATFRYDGSSRFAPEKRWGFFPAMLVGWRIDKEPFFEYLSNKINFLKLRGSVGTMGNQQTVSLYGYMNTVVLNQDYNFNDMISSGAAVTSQGNPNITWERTTTYNAGADFEVNNGKFGGSLDIYKRRTVDILRAVGIPGQVGALAGPIMNVGVVDNKGYEVLLYHRSAVGAFSYKLNGSVGYVTNKVVDLDGETIINGRRIIKEGFPIDAYYLLEADGIYQNIEEVQNSVTTSGAVKPGYIRYIDHNNDRVIDGEDRVIIGSSIPRYTYSFGLDVSYKNISLNTFFQGVAGVNIYPTANLAFPFNNGAGVTKEWETDAWTPEHRNARLPILTTATGATENFQNSTFWLKDASYLRLKNIQVNYRLPKDWLTALSLTNLTVFANGNNLFTFSKFKMFDPEKNIGKDNLYEYPSLKTYSFGLNVTF
ncbi:TonB-dependent receptor [Sphingobacterium sp. SGG-5]|uniref:TonB-dependent receptor n=1 Tax=Sphingobacterium sp. SGG-5 TaxID=2710881 RepID=UPI001F0D5F53|nr:TonB-dependent receptor [Sphingobacterium sp. SGG-5]